MKYIISPRKYLIENLQVILHKNPVVADITSTQILLQIQRHKGKGKYIQLGCLGQKVLPSQIT